MTAGRRPLRPTRAEQLAALHETLARAVEALVEGDAWKRMLDLAARLPHYSPANVLLIRAQCPDASLVMGYRAWTEHDRHVIKGQKGIAILAPCMYAAPEDDGPVPASEVLDPVEKGRRILRGYRVVHVFDVSQTAGAEVRPRATQLQGAAPPLLISHLSRLIIAAGFDLSTGDCGSANGYTDFANRRVRIREGLEGAHAVKTLAHELGHIRAGHEHRFLDPAARSVTCRGVAEVEAESIAYLIVTSAGQDTSAYSVPYIAEWGGGADAVRESASHVLTVATDIQNEISGMRPSQPGSLQADDAAHDVADTAAERLARMESMTVDEPSIPDPALTLD